jgi:hypothetical protein
MNLNLSPDSAGASGVPHKLALSAVEGSRAFCETWGSTCPVAVTEQQVNVLGHDDIQAAKKSALGGAAL